MELNCWFCNRYRMFPRFYWLSYYTLMTDCYFLHFHYLWHPLLPLRRNLFDICPLLLQKSRSKEFHFGDSLMCKSKLNSLLDFWKSNLIHYQTCASLTLIHYQTCASLNLIHYQTCTSLIHYQTCVSLNKFITRLVQV